MGRGVPLPNKEATRDARTLVDQVFSRHGMPVQILSDQGNEMDSPLVREIFRSYSIDIDYDHGLQTLDQLPAERFHRSLNSMLGKVVSDSQREWVEPLPYVMAKYRDSHH